MKWLCMLVLLSPSGWSQTSADSLHAQSWNPGDHELFFMPTANTMPVGNVYFTAYELLYLNFVYAPTSSTHIGISSPIPVFADFTQFLTFGVKQNLFKEKLMSGAVWATWSPHPNLWALGGVLSAGSTKAGIHAGFGYVANVDDDYASTLWMLGGNLRLSRRVTLIVEYENSSEYVNDFPGFLAFGLRIGDRSACLEIAGVRPLMSINGNEVDWPFLPLLKVTIML